jgi:hypothetical protein
MGHDATGSPRRSSEWEHAQKGSELPREPVRGIRRARPGRAIRHHEQPSESRYVRRQPFIVPDEEPAGQRCSLQIEATGHVHMCAECGSTGRFIQRSVCVSVRLDDGCAGRSRPALPIQFTAKVGVNAGQFVEFR